MGKKIRILYVASMNTDSGVARFLMNYVRHMDLTRFDLSFLTLRVWEPNFHEELRSMGCTVYEACGYARHPLRWLQRIRKIVKEGHYDIVHANEAIMGVPVLYFAWRAKIPVRIAHSHSTNMPSKIKTAIVTCCRPLFWLFSNQYFACSQMAGEYLFGKQMYAKKPHRIIYNAIDINHFAFSEAERGETRARLHIENKIVLGHIGRFIGLKNHSFLIDVMDEILKVRNDFVLILLGDGEMKPEIERKVQEKRLENYVFFLGIQKDVAPYLSAMDVFLLPSVFEGLGIVLIEAQASGLKCIASNKVPPEAAVLESYLQLPITNAELWAESILVWMDSAPERRCSNALEALRNAGYDIDGATRQLEKGYQVALQGK